jgi:hypothetical protein
MKRGGTGDAEKKPPAGFPALRGFFSAYLHQDFRDEYGSAAAAAAAFSNDAEPSEVAAVDREWKTWRAQLGKFSPAGAAAAIRKLGGAWQPLTPGDLDQLERALASGNSQKQA